MQSEMLDYAIRLLCEYVKYSCLPRFTISGLSPEGERDMEEESVAGTFKFRGHAGRVVNKVREPVRQLQASSMLNDELKGFIAKAGLNPKLEL